MDGLFTAGRYAAGYLEFVPGRRLSESADKERLKMSGELQPLIFIQKKEASRGRMLSKRGVIKI